MKSPALLASAVLASFLLAAACGSSSGPPAAPAPSTWKDMNLEERLDYMKEVVMPQAKEIFVAFDAVKYAEMDCKTCHGDGAADGSWEMPNPKIKVLPGTPEAYMAWIGQDADAARYTQFMAEKVEPLMGKVLQRSVFDPSTGQGELSCETCHVLEGTEGAELPPHDHDAHADTHADE